MSKDALSQLADAAQVALLYDLADHGGERYAKLAGPYPQHFLANEPFPSWVLNDPEVWWPFEDY